ncbi:hypothetical protein LO80_07735 [Candidatus Francisella endociliophora]|uniref:RHS repeat-associated core domain-containing protein n=1 Tax=Candidatus Francisella endociliophora TaxID=653937 RepID=A0A097EQM4_9GAMM|nr:glycohydrolase toxin TNT-related protein [Francisella sp. FSC1006]AIT09870.1 hypothetical protein LO80_07735 [Francisella sp. FSC1006]
MKLIKLSLLATGLLVSLNSFASYTWTADYSASNGDSTKKVTAPNGTTTYSYRQGFGKPILLSKTRGVLSNTADYDDEGRLLSLSQGGKTRTYNYSDSTHLDWLMSQDDPELGTTNYTYYPNGLRKSEQISGGSTTNYEYDGNGNITKVSYSAAGGISQVPTITYDYDANNNVTSKTISATNQIANTYDAMDRVLSSTLTYNGINNSISYAYDDYGHISTITYPDGLVVNYNPDGLGRSKAISTSAGNIISSITYSPANNITGYSGNSYSLAITYDSMNRISSIKSTSASKSYTYDGENNVTAITDNNSSANSASFGYDANNRLTTASGYWGQANYSYDNLNNITSLSDSKTTNSYTYGGNNLLSSVTSTANGSESISYDANGNIINEGGDSYTYDSANHLISFKNADHTITFDYDPNGNVISTTQDSNKPVITRYDESGKLVYKLDPNKASNQVTDYIYLNGKLAVEATHNDGDLTNIAYHYITTNALGSPIASTLNGATEYSQDYKPYGIEQNDKDSDHLGFTGKETIKDMGLVNMNARYYSPGIGRFMAYDPAEPTVDDLSSFNRYSYANDNPLRYTDPTGLFSFSDFFHGAGNFASGMMNGMSGGFINTGHQSGFAHDAGWAFGTALGFTYGASELKAATYATGKAGGLIESSTTAAVTERNVVGQANVTKDLVKYYPENDGFIGEIVHETLKPGTLIDRFGSKNGRFLSPANTPMKMRALPPGAKINEYRTYRVIKPLNVKSGRIAPAFNQPGMGKQYVIDRPVKDIIDKFIEEV